MGGKRFSKGRGGHLYPSGSWTVAPNEASAEDHVLFEVEDLGPEESVCFSGDQSAWECPPEDEFGMCGPCDVQLCLERGGQD